MRILLRAPLPLSLLFGAFLALAAGIAPAADPVEKTLGNGLKVIVKTDHRAPVAVQQVWYRAGSMDENYGVTGVAHLLEHMMFKGTPTVPAGEFSRRIAALGGRENAFTSRDHTAYFQTLQSGLLPQAMQLEADRMAHLTLSPAEFAKEIQVVMEERRLRTDDNPQALLHEQLMATAYQTHPYHHPVIGWMNDLRQMTAADARDWYTRWYAPNNAVLVVVGDVDPQQVFAWAEQYYGAIPARTLPVRKAGEETPASGPRRVVVRAPAKQPLALLAWPAPRLADPARDADPYALEMLAAVLDGHASARLPQALVKNARIADEVGAGYDAIGRGPGLFTAEIVPAEGKSLAEAVAALKGELARVAREGVSAEELARVKAQLLAGQVFQRDSLFYQAMLIGEAETAGLSWRVIDARYVRLRAVTPEQVQAAAKAYLTDDRLTLAELEPLPLPASMPAGQMPKPMSSGGGHVH